MVSWGYERVLLQFEARNTLFGRSMILGRRWKTMLQPSTLHDLPVVIFDLVTMATRLELMTFEILTGVQRNDWEIFIGL